MTDNTQSVPTYITQDRRPGISLLVYELIFKIAERGWLEMAVWHMLLLPHSTILFMVEPIPIGDASLLTFIIYTVRI